MLPLSLFLFTQIDLLFIVLCYLLFLSDRSCKFWRPICTSPYFTFPTKVSKLHLFNMIELRDHLFNIVQLRDDSTNATSTSTTPHYWKYTPSIPAAAIFAVLYTVTTLWHMVQAGKMRTYYFIPLIVGGICESRHISDMYI